MFVNDTPALWCSIEAYNNALCVTDIIEDGSYEEGYLDEEGNWVQNDITRFNGIRNKKDMWLRVIGWIEVNISPKYYLTNPTRMSTIYFDSPLNPNGIMDEAVRDTRKKFFTFNELWEHIKKYA